MDWSRSWRDHAGVKMHVAPVSARRKLLGLTVLVALVAASHKLAFSSLNAGSKNRAASTHVHAVGAWPQRHPPSRRPLVQVRAMDPEKQVSVGDFMLGAGYEAAELETLAASIAQTTSDKLWDMTDFPKMEAASPVKGAVPKELPKYKRWMNEMQFQAAAKRISPSSSGKTADVLFKVLAQGNGGFLMKEKAESALQYWGGTSTFNAAAFQTSMLGAKFNIGFAYWFLNIFAPFCTYFFFLRPPLLQYLGIDLLPNFPKWWIR